MITRGHLIGQIIDDLSDIAGQVETRCKLSLTDLNLHLENFYKEILSATYGLNLENLNAQRLNTAGLDLGDTSSGVAYQVTATRTSQKVNKTLKKISKPQRKTYPEIFVFIVRKKQRSYSLDEKNAKACNFNEDNILDFHDLCRDLMSADLEVIHTVYDICKRETRRVKIELEIPDLEGNYPTGAADLAERIPTPSIGSGKAYFAYLKSHGIVDEETPKLIKNDLTELSAKLQRLPRITRDIFVEMIERREPDKKLGPWDYGFCINADRLDRIFDRHAIDGDIRILSENDFIDLVEPDEGYRSGLQSYHFSLCLPQTPEGFLPTMIEFLDEKNVRLRKVLVSLDFSDF